VANSKIHLRTRLGCDTRARGRLRKGISYKEDSDLEDSRLEGSTQIQIVDSSVSAESPAHPNTRVQRDGNKRKRGLSSLPAGTGRLERGDPDFLAEDVESSESDLDYDDSSRDEEIQEEEPVVNKKQKRSRAANQKQSVRPRGPSVGSALARAISRPSRDPATFFNIGASSLKF